jgi:hypothetical protein
MPQIRFSTARSLLDSFPELANQFTAALTDEAPLDFLRKLSSQAKFDDGVTFCSHLLPRREAVWWACGTIKASSKDGSQGQSEGFLAAQKWVYDPSEENRLAALETGNKSDKAKPSTWLALGAGWSGGMLSSHPKAPVPMPHYLTPRAARIAILLNAQPIPAAERAAGLRACITEGIKLAETGL